jgi:hypothetical protein
MSYRNYRGEIAKSLKKPSHKGNIFFQGNKFWAVESMGTDSLSTHILDAAVLRGVESDAAAVRKIACSRQFWLADMATKTATLEKYFDVNRLFSSMGRHETPTNYLRSWWSKP